MKYVILIMTIIGLFSFSARGQVEKSEFFFGVTYQPGFAFKKSTKDNMEFILKSQYKLKKNNAVTISVSIASPMRLSKIEEPIYIDAYSVIPLLVWYKKIFNKFYFEPQIGAGIFSK